MWSLNCKNLSGMEALLTAEADPNQRAKYGITTVTMASGYRNSKLLNLLLDYKGDPNTVEEDGLTFALSVSFELGVYEDIWDNFYLLLNRGADINLVTPAGNTITEHAILFGRYCRVIEMLELGYTNDLLGLLSIAQARSDPASSENKKCKYELIELLEKRIAQ